MQLVNAAVLIKCSCGSEIEKHFLIYTRDARAGGCRQGVWGDEGAGGGV